MTLIRKLTTGLLVGALFIGMQPSTEAADDSVSEKQIVRALKKSGGTVFPIGNPNTAYERYFTGRSWLYALTGADDNVVTANVTFEPGCINHWHIHHGSCQVLAGVSGRGYYQIWGEEVHELLPGQSVTIPEGTKHWHGAQNGSWFQHLAIMSVGASTEWLEPVDPFEYSKLQ